MKWIDVYEKLLLPKEFSPDLHSFSFLLINL